MLNLPELIVIYIHNRNLFIFILLQHMIKYDRTTNMHSQLSNKVLKTFNILYYDYLHL
jgi:hypothetical protein